MLYNGIVFSCFRVFWVNIFICFNELYEIEYIRVGGWVYSLLGFWVIEKLVFERFVNNFFVKRMVRKVIVKVVFFYYLYLFYMCFENSFILFVD